LRDEGLAYAEKLSVAGIDVVLKRYDDMTHGFFTLVDLITPANAAVQEVAALIAERIEQDLGLAYD
jgi:acetyl esterase